MQKSLSCLQGEGEHGTPTEGCHQVTKGPCSSLPAPLQISSFQQSYLYSLEIYGLTGPRVSLVKVPRTKVLSTIHDS